MTVVIGDVKEEMAVSACAGASAPDLDAVPVAQELDNQVVMYTVNIKRYGPEPIFDIVSKYIKPGYVLKTLQ